MTLVTITTAIYRTRAITSVIILRHSHIYCIYICVCARSYYVSIMARRFPSFPSFSFFLSSRSCATFHPLASSFSSFFFHLFRCCVRVCIYAKRIKWWKIKVVNMTQSRGLLHHCRYFDSGVKERERAGQGRPPTVLDRARKHGADERVMKTKRWLCSHFNHQLVNKPLCYYTVSLDY